MSKALVVLGAQWGDEGKVRIWRRNPSDRGITEKNMAHPHMCNVCGLIRNTVTTYTP